jgi:hypothetical protein
LPPNWLLVVWWVWLGVFAWKGALPVYPVA